MFLLVYTNRGDNAKRFNAQKYCLPKSIIKNDKIIINGKTFYDQVIDSDIKPYEEIRKLTTGQGENYTTGCLIDYDYIKNHYIINSNLFEQTKWIRLWSKSNSTCWTIKKTRC